MRIAIIGSPDLNKSKLLVDFITTWPQYTTHLKTFKDTIQENCLSSGLHTNEKSQQAILSFFLEQERKYHKGDKVISNQCCLSSLAYSLWAYEKGLLSKEHVDRTIAYVVESLRFLDVLFFVPSTCLNRFESLNDNNISNNVRSAFNTEIYNIFKALVVESNRPISPFFARDDKPAIIEIFGSPQERIEMIKLYLDNDGDEIGEGKIIDPNELD